MKKLATLAMVAVAAVIGGFLIQQMGANGWKLPGAPADMDTAMRLGFNWPRGPLELTELIGAGRAVDLLEELRQEHGEAYAPAPRLIAAGQG